MAYQYMLSDTRTHYGTVKQTIADYSGNYPTVRKEYIPSEGSKFHKVGITKITKHSTPYSTNKKSYSVMRDGKRTSYSLEGLRKLFKDLDLQNIKGHAPIETFGIREKSVLAELKREFLQRNAKASQMPPKSVFENLVDFAKKCFKK